MRPTAERVAAALARLRVRVEDVTVTSGAIDVPSYPDGPRPTSTVTLTGAGHVGRGEHVGWTREAHAAFAMHADCVPRGTLALTAWSAAMREVVPAVYDRAAIEAAAVDLALRQHDTTLFALAGTAPRDVRYVRSFDRMANPLPAVRDADPVAVKLDADGAWSDDVLRELAALGRVAVVDWKTTGTAAEHARIADALPDALVEDPGPADGAWGRLACARRVSADGWLAHPDDLAALPAAPGAVNLKVGRMGGVFPTLALAAVAEARGMAAYVGGMFEVGVGRSQAQTLAALLTPDGPNDVAPLGGTKATALRLVVLGDTPGFGGRA